MPPLPPASLGAVFVCAQFGISPEPREENAYVANWLAALTNDNRCIFAAASAAQKAVGYLDGLQPTVPTETRTNEICQAGTPCL